MTKDYMATVEDLAAELKARRKEIAGREAYFELRRDSDRRAVHKWREAGNDPKDWPSRIDLLTWLMHHLDGQVLTWEDEDSAWREMFGRQYRAIMYGRFEAVHPHTIREVVSKLQAGEPCPEAVDCIASVVNAQMLSQQCQRNMAGSMTEMQAEIYRLRMEVSRLAEGRPAIVDQS